MFYPRCLDEPGGVDIDGDTCDYYKLDNSECGKYDTEDFNATE